MLSYRAHLRHAQHHRRQVRHMLGVAALLCFGRQTFVSSEMSRAKHTRCLSPLTEYGVLAFIATCPRAQHSDWAISYMCNHAHRQLHVAEESQLHVPLAQLNDVQSQVAGCGAPQEPSPGADVAAASPVPVQMWQRCRPCTPQTRAALHA